MACLYGPIQAQEPKVPARILAFEAVPRSVQAGQSVELRWVALDVDRVRLDPSGEAFPAQGRTIRVLEQNTVFWLHAVNAKGGQSVPLVIEVRPSRGAVLEPILPRAPQTALPKPPEALHGNWIQFAALANGTRARQLKASLEGLSGHAVHLSMVDVPNRPGLTLHRVRMGPFITREEAKRLLKEITARIRNLHLKSWIAED